MPPTIPFTDRLCHNVADLERRYLDVIARSKLRNVDLNRGGGGGVVFVGFARWGWAPDPDLVPDRTQLLVDFDEWLSLFRLLHRQALPETDNRITEAVNLLRRWLTREGGDHSIPAQLDQARDMVVAAFEELRALVRLLAPGPGRVLVVPDTNVLLGNSTVSSDRPSAAHTTITAWRFLATTTPFLTM